MKSIGNVLAQSFQGQENSAELPGKHCEELMDELDWLTEEQMRARVRDGLIVSIDLLIQDERDRWLLAFRKNRPAQSSWFVPGGRVRKGEKIPEAFERLVRFEFGRELPYTSAQFHGVYVHYYDDNRWNDPDFGTHYLVLAHQVKVDSSWGEVIHAEAALEQHHQLRWFGVGEALANGEVHPYTKIYVKGVKSSTGVMELFPHNFPHDLEA
jgi:colanic acid biosynthesis protein WcaH